MQISLYSFTKRTNSTKRPSGDGTIKHVKLKTACDLYSPIFELAEDGRTLKSYNYLVYDDFFYYIDSITLLSSSQSEIRCTLDVYATLKSYIVATQGFCVYGSKGSYNKEDPRIILTPEILHNSVSASVSLLSNASFSPCFYVNIAGSDGTKIYIMTPGELASFLTELNNAADDVRQQIASIYGNIYGAINSVTASPIYISSNASGTIKLAGWTSAGTHHFIDPAGTNARVTIAEGVAPEMRLSLDYPFMAFSPYSSYRIFLPWVGEVPLSDEAVLYGREGGIYCAPVCNASFDIPSCSVTWSVSSIEYAGGAFGWDSPGQKNFYSASLGRNIGIAQNVSNTAANIFNAIKSVVGIAEKTISGALSGGVAGGVAGGLSGAAGAAFDIMTYNWGGNLQTVTTYGEQGGGILLHGANANKVVLTRYYHEPDGNNLSSSVMGAPVGKVGAAGSFGGFVLMRGASVSAPFPAWCIDAANAALASGLYIE